jgi:hypothetical protein
LVAGRGLYGEGKGVIPSKKGKKGGNMDPRGTKGAMTKIRIIDMSAWTDEDRANFRISLTSLKTGIDKYLGTLGT